MSAPRKWRAALQPVRLTLCLCLCCVSACARVPVCVSICQSEQNRVVVRDSESLDVLRTYSCLDGVSELAWSPDSEYLLASQLKRKIVQVFSVADPSWTCKIDEALAGLTHACWAPDSRHILTRSEYNLRLSIWSLVRKQVTYIRTPKLMAALAGSSDDAPVLGGNAGIRFSNGGTLLAVLSRVECKDVLSIYSVAADAASPTGGWDLLKQFHIDTDDCVQIEWAPNDAHILCVDSALQYNIAVYTPSGQKLASHRAYEHALGVKGAGQGVRWSPHNSFLAIGSYDQNVRIFNNATWTLVHSYVHSSAAVNALAGSAAARAKQSSNLVLYVEKPLQPNHAVSKLALATGADPDKENTLNPLDETAVDASVAGDDLEASMRSTIGQLKGLSVAGAAAKKKPAPGAVGAKAKPAAARPGSAAASKSKLSSSSSSSSALTSRSRAASSAASAEVEKATISVPSKCQPTRHRTVQASS